jgi:hypothetical protein
MINQRVPVPASAAGARLADSGTGDEPSNHTNSARGWPQESFHKQVEVRRGDIPPNDWTKAKTPLGEESSGDSFLCSASGDDALTRKSKP